MPANLVRRAVVAADGLVLHAVEGGNHAGPTILLLHGYLFSGAVFSRQFSGDLAQTYRLIAFDLRGHGGSERPDILERYLDPEVWADDVACVLDAFEVDRAILCGWSLGGRVALNYAWHHGCTRVAGLALVGSITAPASHGVDAALPPSLAGLLDIDRAERNAATRSFVEACAQPAGISDEMADGFTATAMASPIAARRGARGWPLRYEANLNWVTCPLLFVPGSDDLMAPHAAVRAEAEAANQASVSAIEGGHLAFLQNSRAFDASLAAFAEKSFSIAERSSDART